MMQPHQGIVGTDRAGDPLVSLAGALLPARDAIFGVGWNLYRVTIVGSPAPLVAKMRDRIHQPEPGDYVGILDTAYRRNMTDAERLHRCGYLVACRRELMHTDDEWRAALEAGEWREDDKRPSDDAIYVQYGPAPGDLARWTNATAFGIPLTDQAWID